VTALAAMHLAVWQCTSCAAAALKTIYAAVPDLYFNLLCILAETSLRASCTCVCLSCPNTVVMHDNPVAELTCCPVQLQ
jgi:hypothetical protein